MTRRPCPCCGYFTVESDDEVEVIVDICEVCFWQYDKVGQNHPDISIGPNHVSLNDAKKNYRNYGACEHRVINFVRMPLSEELPENNN